MNTAKACQLPHGPTTVDVSRVPPFSILHLDFSFFGKVSLGGYTTVLDIVCASTSFAIGFTSKSKSPPLDYITYVVKTLHLQGYNPFCCMVDEDGALARLSEFCQLIIHVNMVFDATGGGNSTTHGKVERQHQL